MARASAERGGASAALAMIHAAEAMRAMPAAAARNPARRAGSAAAGAAMESSRKSIAVIMPYLPVLQPDLPMR